MSEPMKRQQLVYLSRRKSTIIIGAPEYQAETIKAEGEACYTIEQVATRTGLTKRTLRYYEEVGLMPPADRTEGNYRLYSEEDIQRLERIKAYKHLLGFSLQEIRKLLDVEQERGQIHEMYRQEAETQAKIVQLDKADGLIQQQLQLIEQKIEGLERMRASLQQHLTRHIEARKKLRAR
jgi:DNA-binding transcriptional MerR regulator